MGRPHVVSLQFSADGRWEGVLSSLPSSWPHIWGSEIWNPGDNSVWSTQRLLLSFTLLSTLDRCHTIITEPNSSWSGEGPRGGCPFRVLSLVDQNPMACTLLLPLSASPILKPQKSEWLPLVLFAAGGACSQGTRTSVLERGWSSARGTIAVAGVLSVGRWMRNSERRRATYLITRTTVQVPPGPHPPSDEV